MSLLRSITLHTFWIHYIYVAYRGLFAQFCPVSSAKFLFILLLPPFALWPFILVLITVHVLLCKITLHTNAQFTYCTMATLKSFSVKIFLYFLQRCLFCSLEQFWIRKTIFMALFVTPHLCIIFAAVWQKCFLFYRDIKKISENTELHFNFFLWKRHFDTNC